MISKGKKWLPAVIALAVFTLLFFFLGLDKLFFAGPQGMHFWRKTDSLSFAAQYFNNGFDFFHPQLFNLSSEEARAASEFPILYYITALLYTVLGKHEVILRILNLIIIYWGAYSVYRLSRLILKDTVYAILIALFLFTSTVFNYYSFNFLPDNAALGLVLSGLYYTARYYLKPHRSFLLAGFILFTLSGLTKVTFLIAPIAMFCFSFAGILFSKKSPIPKQTAKMLLLSLAGVFLIVLSWIVYIRYYNAEYHSNEFLRQAVPLWKMTGEEISITWNHITHYWYSKYFAHSSFHFLYAIIIFQVIALNKTEKRLGFITLIMGFGVIIYTLLFYEQLKYHDYYFLALVPGFIFFLINGIKTLGNLVQHRIVHMVVKVVMGMIVIAGINYSRMKLEDRISETMNDYSSAGLLINNNIDAINNLDIPEDAKVVVAPDLCTNGGLYYLNRMGWILRTNADITVMNLDNFRQQGAEYLVLTTTDPEVNKRVSSISRVLLETENLRVYEFVEP